MRVNKIVVRTQKQLDSLPLVFLDYTEIEIRSRKDCVINVRYQFANADVMACGRSYVAVYNAGRVVARENSVVAAFGPLAVAVYGSK